MKRRKYLKYSGSLGVFSLAGCLGNNNTFNLPELYEEMFERFDATVDMIEGIMNGLKRANYTTDEFYNSRSTLTERIGEIRDRFDKFKSGYQSLKKTEDKSSYIENTIERISKALEYFWKFREAVTSLVNQRLEEDINGSQLALGDSKIYVERYNSFVNDLHNPDYFKDNFENYTQN